MSQKHPKGLVVLALTNMGERFGYYTMLAILTLYLQAKFGFSSAVTSLIYGSFLALVYFLPVFGGIVADKWLGYGRTILIGVVIMFAGYLLLSLPMGVELTGIVIMALSLILISAGTGLFKGNLQALVGKMYDDPRYSAGRDMAFSIFYMFINIGAFFAPSMGNYITESQLSKQGFFYDASIPANYVALNDDVVNEQDFLDKLNAENPKFSTMSKEEQENAITKAKKDDGVMFQADRDAKLFALKAAALHQYTRNGKLTDPAKTVTDEDYAALNTREKTEEALAKKQEVTDRINNINDRELFPLLGDTQDYAVQKMSFAEKFGEKYVADTLSISYSLAFVVACISLVISILIFILFKSTWKSSDVTVKQSSKNSAAADANAAPAMSKHEVRERMIALGLVFVVVIFFWMAFHQNGLTMTFFARDYTLSEVTPLQFMVFPLWVLIPFAVFMYGIYLSTFGLLGGSKNVKWGISLIIVGIAGLACAYFFGINPMETAKDGAAEMQKITPQIFQQFNPFFIILLTPVTVGIFAALANRKKEPSAPRKIGIGMLLASVGFLVLLSCCAMFALPDPSTLHGPSSVLVSPNWLIGTYLVLTLAELFLSPMGLSFVSKVAPPQYAGLMQGGWLAATAVGNLLVGVMGSLWEKMSLVAFWGVLIACCLLSAAFIFSIMKRLERVTK